ncbi:hypothetical protein [[Mycobacterium] wendilense]|uniref:Mammalian cell entry protein n=1 Tax=[Mycobacterium] wendilense TaxID=3064284 RepID=A0ABM9MJ42_9MYCO|nr:hypothetical protein [Mycolicibacterium sp. MU0050]CAJ1586425.1 hypothetical protein MU0050_004274 [Mycolicibacterium sp. MU0050]
MPTGDTAAEDAVDDAAAAGPAISGYGIAAAVLAVVAVIAAVLATMIWSGHRDHDHELDHRTRVMQAAVDWTNVLINLNTDNVDASLQTLQEGTVGQLNSDFDSAVRPYREVVQTLQARTTGRIESVAFESIHNDLDREPGSPPPASPLPPEMSARTDHVLVIASSVSENVGGQPQTVRWNLRLGVSEVDGQLLISQLESLR